MNWEEKEEYQIRWKREGKTADRKKGSSGRAKGREFPWSAPNRVSSHLRDATDQTRSEKATLESKMRERERWREGAGWQTWRSSSASLSEESPKTNRRARCCSSPIRVATPAGDVDHAPPTAHLPQTPMASTHPPTYLGGWATRPEPQMVFNFNKRVGYSLVSSCTTYLFSNHT